MLEMLIVIGVGLVGGVAVGVQSPIAGAMGQRIGGAAGSFIVHLSGTLVSALLLVLRGGEQIGQWRSLSWYMLGSGIFGVVLYLTINHTLPRLGATGAILCIIIGQLLTGIVIDVVGLFGVTPHPLDAGRILGIALLAFGAYLVIR